MKTKAFQFEIILNNIQAFYGLEPCLYGLI